MPKILPIPGTTLTWTTPGTCIPPLHRRWSSHLRNHRKLLIADGRKAFTGGMNIGKKYMGPRSAKEQWRDDAAVIDVTRRSIEETAAAILRLYHDRGAPVLDP